MKRGRFAFASPPAAIACLFCCRMNRSMPIRADSEFSATIISAVCRRKMIARQLRDRRFTGTSSSFDNQENDGVHLCRESATGRLRKPQFCRDLQQQLPERNKNSRVPDQRSLCARHDEFSIFSISLTLNTAVSFGANIDHPEGPTSNGGLTD